MDFFLGFHFLSVFAGSMISVHFLFFWPDQLVCPQEMPAGVGVWDAGVS